MAALKIRQTDIHTIIFDFDGTLAKLNIDFQKMREVLTALILSHGIASDQLRSHFVLEMIDDAYEILNQRSDPEAGAFLVSPTRETIYSISFSFIYIESIEDDTQYR